MARKKKDPPVTTNLAVAPVSRNSQMNSDFATLVRARNTLIWMITREELRVERAMVEAAAVGKYETVFWDFADGITSATGETIEATQDPVETLNWIEKDKNRRVYVMRDLHKLLGDPLVLRKLRNLARKLQNTEAAYARSIVVLTPSAEVPPELQGHAIVLDYPLPERPEIAAILTSVLDAVASKPNVELPDETIKSQAIDAAIGMNSEEIGACYSRSFVLHRKLDPALISAEKRRIVARERVLTWYEPDPRGLDAVGGLEVLKTWLTERKRGLSLAAREYGLKPLKGCVLTGVPGCGKSLTAKAIASAWGLPLLRLDLGSLKSKWVGESEANIRRALAVAEAVSPCVVWLEEIEKALAGSTGQQGDGGVSSDALNAILTWLQERTGTVFVVATANDLRTIPGEFLRRGRFDAIFWVDLPTFVERKEILSVAIRDHGRNSSDFDLDTLARETKGFTGSEIAALVGDALFASFSDGARPLSLADLLHAASCVVPLAKTSGERIEVLRAWSVGKAIPASIPEHEPTKVNVRAGALDI